MDLRRFDVFLSYNRSDERAVERVAEHLLARGVEVWWDRRSLIAGRSWQQGILEGLDRSRACAGLVGPSGIHGWHREELEVAQDRAAKDAAFRLFLVLLPGAPDPSDPSLAFLRNKMWLDLKGGVDDPGGLQALIAAVYGVPPQAEVRAVSPGTCPYRGLGMFEEAHAEFFFGREVDVARVLETLRTSRFVAVLGPSGTGKSSLLRAGVVPALRRGRLPDSSTWTIRVLTPGAHPLATVTGLLSEMLGDVPMQQTLGLLSEDHRTLDLVASVTLGGDAHNRLLLVVDQFEELFTLCADERERGAVLDNLLYAATVPGGRVMVVLGMRADFYQRSAAYPALRTLIARHQFLLGPLDPDGLRRVVEEPARRVGLELEAGLTQTIVNDVGGGAGSLPLLEHVLLELCRRSRGTMLTLEGYVASGGVHGALAQAANDVYSRLTETQKAIAQAVLLRLVQPGEGTEDTRRRIEMDELIQGPHQAAELEAVVRALADQRLVTVGRDEVTGSRVVEMTHEALIRGWPELQGWIDEGREQLRALRQLTAAATEWDRSLRRDDDLYSGARLAYWEERQVSDLNELERAFLAASRVRAGRELAERRRRARLAVAGVLAAVTTVAVVALVGFVQVSERSDVARSRQLAAEASVALLGDPARSLKLAVQAYDVAATEEAEHAVRRALSTPGARLAESRVPGSLFLSVVRAAFGPDGRVLTVGGDGEVRVWNWASGTGPAEIRDVGPVGTAAFSPDGKWMAATGFLLDSTVRVWDLSSGASTASPEQTGRLAIAASVAFSPDGQRVVTADGYGVWIWDWTTGAAPTDLTGHEGSFRSASFSPKGDRVVSGGEDGTVRVSDLNTSAEPTMLRGHQGAVRSVAFNREGDRVISAGEDGTVRVWSVDARAEPLVLQGHQGVVRSAAFNGEGNRVISAGEDGTVRVWELYSGAVPVVLRGHVGAVSNVAFSDDNRWALSAGEDEAVRVWDWSSGMGPTVVGAHGGVEQVTLSPNGERVLSVGDGAVWVWELPPTSAAPIVLRDQGGAALSAAFSPNGERVITGGNDGKVRIWDWRTRDAPLVISGHDRGVTAVAFSGNGRWVASGGRDDRVRLWDASSGVELEALETVGGVTIVAFSADGERVVSGGGGSPVLVWDWASREEPTTLSRLPGQATSLAFSPDRRRVVGASQSGDVVVWDLASPSTPTVLASRADVAPAPNDPLNPPRIFDPGPFPGQRLVASVAFTTDNRRVVSADRDGTVRVWDLTSGKKATVLDPQAVQVTSAGVAALPDGPEIVTAGNDGTLRIWRCSACGGIDRLLERARSPVR